jgi:serine/threonine protein kinase/Tol biopolymer transport system component
MAANSLEAGATVSRYSIVGPIGSGGMGEVYKAQDPGLERMIALKILPPDLVRNDERRRRFIQEARSASSLNHPHIVTIHEIGEAVVAGTDAPIHYIAMELVDGSTLTNTIHLEQTDLRTLLGYMAQAADGLAKAHAANIVHRDLKPENIMVTRDGFAKVLDFGLAKLSVRKSATESTADATAVRDETREGAILGTVAYMSPEQVSGKVVDHRSDIFSFGTILYEIAARRRPFDADSDVDVMHKILHDKPVPVDEINPAIPTEVRRMIRRCLAKDPERRYQSMKDLAIELKEIVDEFDELTTSSSSHGSSTHSDAVPLLPRRQPWAWAGAGSLLVVALVIVGMWQMSRRTVADAPAPAAGSLKLQRLTASGNVLNAAISPDGRYVAHVARDSQGMFSVKVRQVATGSEVEIIEPSDRNIFGLAFSPDGNYIYYLRPDAPGLTNRWLYVIPALGGTPRKVLFNADSAPSFSPDGKQLVFERGVPAQNVYHFVIANRDGSGERVLASVPRFGTAMIVAPSWSPDGKAIAGARLQPPAGNFAKPIEIDVATGAIRDIGNVEWWWIGTVSWMPDGASLLMTGMDKGNGRFQIWRQPFPDGAPVQLTNDLNDYLDLTKTADGNTVAARHREVKGELRLSAVDDPTGGTRLETEHSSNIFGTHATSAGAVVYSRGENGKFDVMILDTPASQPRALTTDGTSADASISGDGKTIVFGTFGAIPHIWTIDAEGGVARQVTRGSGEYTPQLSPDGKTLVYFAENALWRIPLAGGSAAKIVDRPSFGGSVTISSDSSLIAYVYWRPNGEGLNVRVEPLAGGAPLLDVPWSGGQNFRWSPGNDGFTYTKASGGATNIFLQRVAGGTPEQLTKFRRGGIGSYAWMPDGKLLLVATETRSDVVLITGLESPSMKNEH